MAMEDRHVQVGFKITVCNFFLVIIKCIMRLWCKFIYCGKGKTLPAIAEDILGDSATEVARQIREHEITSVVVVETCIKRIKEVNTALRCMVEDRFEDALLEAKKADELVQISNPSDLALQKPFLGVPFTTKECIAVKGLHQTSGILMRVNYVAPEDAEVIKLVRESGAILLGVTNVPELCMWWETNNHLFGRTRNPYHTHRIVGGSSGGEGCIQAVGGSFFGIGADMGGSIRMPAFFCGIFGHKPSRYIVPQGGHYPPPANEMQRQCFSIGPMVKCAEDLRPLLDIMAGEKRDILKLDEEVDISQLKLYYQCSNEAPLVDKVDHEIVGAIRNIVFYLQERFEIEAEELNINWIRRTLPIWIGLMKSDKRIGDILMTNFSIRKAFWELFKCIFGCSRFTFVSLVAAILDQLGLKYDSPKHQKIIEERAEMETFFQEMLGDDGVFLFPTHPTPAVYHREPYVRVWNFSYTALINCLGLPATNVPLGLGREKLPIGIQVVANYNNDRYCFALAETLEAAFGGWIEPQSNRMRI